MYLANSAPHALFSEHQLDRFQQQQLQIRPEPVQSSATTTIGQIDENQIPYSEFDPALLEPRPIGVDAVVVVPTSDIVPSSSSVTSTSSSAFSPSSIPSSCLSPSSSHINDKHFDFSFLCKQSQRNTSHNDDSNSVKLQPGFAQSGITQRVVSPTVIPCDVGDLASDSTMSITTITTRSSLETIEEYKDYSGEKKEDYNDKEFKVKGGVAVPFPLKLHSLLEQVDRDGHGHIVTWQPHGRCFIIRKPEEFLNFILPNYYYSRNVEGDTTRKGPMKLRSFERQLNLYGFRKLTSKRGGDHGAYYHPKFLKGKSFLARTMERTRIKNNGKRWKPKPESEPNFWTMTPCA